MTNYYIWFIILLLLVFLPLKRRRRSISAYMITKNNGGTEMLETAKKFIDRKCTVRTIDGNTIWGTIRSVNGKSVIVETSGRANAVNAEYITSIAESEKKDSILKSLFSKE